MTGCETLAGQKGIPVLSPDGTLIIYAMSLDTDVPLRSTIKLIYMLYVSRLFACTKRGSFGSAFVSALMMTNRGNSSIDVPSLKREVDFRGPKEKIAQPTKLLNFTFQ